METSRRGFFGALVAGAVAAVSTFRSDGWRSAWWTAPTEPQRIWFTTLYDPEYWPDLPDDVFCERCGCMQLPNHLSADGRTWHAADGNVYQQLEERSDGTVWPVPWRGGPPQRGKVL